MNCKIRRLKADMDENQGKKDDISRQNNGIKEAKRKRGHKDRKHREVSLRITELISVWFQNSFCSWSNSKRKIHMYKIS